MEDILNLKERKESIYQEVMRLKKEFHDIKSSLTKISINLSEKRKEFNTLDRKIYEIENTVKDVTIKQRSSNVSTATKGNSAKEYLKSLNNEDLMALIAKIKK